jgi:hypothetical protein
MTPHIFAISRVKLGAGGRLIFLLASSSVFTAAWFIMLTANDNIGFHQPQLIFSIALLQTVSAHLPTSAVAA